MIWPKVIHGCPEQSTVTHKPEQASSLKETNMAEYKVIYLKFSCATKQQRKARCWRNPEEIGLPVPDCSSTMLSDGKQ